MPLYEYQCDACDHRFEVIQKYSDAPIETCPKCGGAVKKLLSSPAIQFKGSGWYITDYARAGKSDGANVTSGKNDSGGSTAETKTETETKADTKADTKKDSTPSSSSPASS